MIGILGNMRTIKGSMILLEKTRGQSIGGFSIMVDRGVDIFHAKKRAPPLLILSLFYLFKPLMPMRSGKQCDLYISNPLIQILFPRVVGGEPVVRSVSRVLVDLLIEIDPTYHGSYVFYETGVKVLYLDLLRDIYWTLINIILWNGKSKTI